LPHAANSDHVARQLVPSGLGSAGMKVIYGHLGSDERVIEVDTVTGEVTVLNPGNRVTEFVEIKHGVGLIKYAAQIKDEKLRKSAIQAAGEYLNGKTEILAPNGNIIAIF
jgi:hypothetical protein